MATLDWSDCPLVEIISGKVSGAPLLKNTRLAVDAITGNYDAFRDEGLSPDAAITGLKIGAKVMPIQYSDFTISRQRLCGIRTL